MSNASMQMQSISGIITQIHVSKEEIPPPLVGASIDVVDNKVFVFAGRLASSRKLTNFLYILDLDTLCWSQHIPPPDSEKPPNVRYFHSTSVYKNQLIVFGGMGYSRTSTDGLCVLDDVMIFDIETMCWKKPTVQPSLYSPQSRYAHLSSVLEDKLLIIGGQDLDNNYLDELNVLNLKTWEWEQMKTFEKHVGAYRSVAVAASPGTRIPSTVIKSTSNNNNDENNENNDNESTEESGSQHGRRSSIRPNVQSVDKVNPVYLYTNFNFTDVKRELQLIFPSTSPQVVIEDCSSFMNGVVMPPGLRFPTGHTLGNHLILAGTYLSPQSQSFTIWSLDLGKLTWSRIETGTVFSTGSWNRGVLQESTNRFIVFGNTNRSLVDDYNHRQVNFDHVAFVDLEAFGVYALPKITCSSLAQEMGLRLLNEPAVSDFNIVTQDNVTIPVNSAVLCQRWPYFANLMKENQLVINQTDSKQTAKEGEEEQEQEQEEEEDQASLKSQRPDGIKLIKTHYMSFPYPHAVVIALLQFIYTDNLLTAQQYQPHVLSQLLLLSDMYEIPRLCELATHALHQMLNMSTAPLIFETAALSHQTSLQIRALKMMIAAKKMIQQQQQLQQSVTRSRTLSTPTSSTNITDLPPPISPTTSLSSSTYNNSSLDGASSRLSSLDQTMLNSLTSSNTSRKPSINSRTVLQQRSSTMAYKSSYSPPSTPNRQRSYSPSELESYGTQRSSSPPPKSEAPVKPISKEKKKKKAFLEAFGKFSSLSK